MAMTPWSAFLPYVVPDVYECPTVTVELAVRDAAIEFFRRTHVWKETSDVVRTRAGRAVYDMETPPNVMVETLYEVEFNGRRTGPARPDGIPGWLRGPGSPVRFTYLHGTDEIEFHPAPADDGEMRMTMVLTPSSTSSGIESFYFERYRDGIVHGAKWKLMMVPGKPWTNPAMAEYHARRFSFEISEARVRADHGASNRVRPRPFA